jgi:hypothetical protein
VNPRRGLLVWLLLLLIRPSVAAPQALILIPHASAGPNLPSADYLHGEWILWPEDQGEGRFNRLLSLVTGRDLQGEVADGNFRMAEEGWLSTHAARLAERGFFTAREAYLAGWPSYVLLNSSGTLGANMRLLGLEDPKRAVIPHPYAAPLPDHGLVVYEAKDWDHAIWLTKRVERSLIVEFPPDGKDRWSRYWLYGDWQKGTPIAADVGVPGLIRAREALALLTRPASFGWHPSNVGRWGGANRWLEYGRDVSPMVLCAWFCISAIIVTWAIAQVMNEDRGPFVSELVVGVALSPAAIVLGGAMARGGGLEAWPVWLILSSLVLYGLSLLVGLGARRWWPDLHPLWPASLLGIAILTLFDPLWSDLSPRFGHFDLDVSGAAVGAAVGYLTGAIAFAPGRGFGRALAVAALLWGITARPWWVGGHSAFLVLPAAALAASEGLLRPAALLLFVFLPTGIWKIVRDGAAWNPLGLLANAGQARALNFWQHFAFGISEGWIGTFCLVGLGLLLGTRFLAYRLHKLLHLDPRLRAFPWMLASVAALGFTEPLMLPAVSVLVFAVLVVLAYDGLRANA